MRAPVYALIGLFITLVCSATFVTQYYRAGHTRGELQARCEDVAVEHNRDRIRACRAILRRYVFAPWYRGAINSQLCAALGKAQMWKKAVDACTEGNDPYQQYANFLNRAVAYEMLGEKEKAEADLVEAALIKTLTPKEPPASK